MVPLNLREFHLGLGARFIEVNGAEVVSDYGDSDAEAAALRQSAGMLDLSFRGRLCLTGADRVRFLHGQVTNDVKKLDAGQGCYAALTTAKGKMQSDLNIYCLPEELLLDFEPGLSETIACRLEKYIVADDVQVVDVAPMYGLLSVQGPGAEPVVNGFGMAGEVPARPFQSVKVSDAALGEVYVMNQPRLGTSGFDLYVPLAAARAAADQLIAAAKAVGGRACGWQACERARVEAGIPRFGADMDEAHFPQECGIEGRAVSYTKGCYIGQEVLNRIHTMGHVTRELRGLKLAGGSAALPVKGDKLFLSGKEVGYITSAAASATSRAGLALAYVRKEASRTGTQLALRTAQGESTATIVDLPSGAA